MSSIADGLLESLVGLPMWGKVITVIGISMLPFIELRGALPAAINIFDFPWHKAILLSILGNLIPIPFIMILFKHVEKFLRRWSMFDRLFEWLFKRTRAKGERKLQVWGDIGLILFVAVPFPVTGAWTGTLVAYLLKLNRLRSFLCIFVGVVIAGLIMTVVSYTHVIWGAVIMIGLFLTLVAIWKIEDLVISRNTFRKDTP